jgi:hypothetical protein
MTSWQSQFDGQSLSAEHDCAMGRQLPGKLIVVVHVPSGGWVPPELPVAVPPVSPPMPALGAPPEHTPPIAG